jgi:UDP-glucose 4-epimerase
MGKGYTLHDMADGVRKAIPGADISVGPGLQFLEGPYHSIYDTTRAQEDLKFKPEFNMETAVLDYVETLKQLKEVE